MICVTITATSVTVMCYFISIYHINNLIIYHILYQKSAREGEAAGEVEPPPAPGVYI